MNTNKLRQAVGRIAVTGGLITSGISLFDGVVNSLTSEEFQARNRVLREMEDKHGVDRECGGGVSGGISFGYCYDNVLGEHTELERDQILTQFYGELNQRVDEIPIDEEERDRSSRDGIGLVGGLGMAVAGSVLKGPGKERG